MLLLLRRQPGEAVVQRVVGQQEGFLAMQHRRVGAVRVVVAIDLPAAQVQPDAAEQRRMRIVVEGGVDQIGQLAGTAMDTVRKDPSAVNRYGRLEGSRIIASLHVPSPPCIARHCMQCRATMQRCNKALLPRTSCLMGHLSPSRV